MKMANKNWALLTGCPSGFTDVICDVLEEQEYNIFLLGRDENKLNNFINERKIKNPIQKYHLIIRDVSKKYSADYVFSEIKKTKKFPNVLIHHLGGTLGIKTSLCSTNEWNNVLNINCLFSFELNRLLLTYLEDNSFARIINIGSISSKSLRGSGPYACSKALLDAYTKTLGRELACSNVSVNSINLGAFETEKSNWSKYRKKSPEIIEDFLRHHHASKRLGDPKEIAPLIKMLLDPEFTFGQGCILEYDGGTM